MRMATMKRRKLRIKMKTRTKRTKESIHQLSSTNQSNPVLQKGTHPSRRNTSLPTKLHKIVIDVQSSLETCLSKLRNPRYVLSSSTLLLLSVPPPHLNRSPPLPCSYFSTCLCPLRYSNSAFQSSLSQLRAHILTFTPTAKIESARIRSIPFATPTAALPTEGDDDDATSRKRAKREKERAAAWRSVQDVLEYGDKREKEEVDTSKTFIDAKGKRKVAFIKKDVSEKNLTVYILGRNINDVQCGGEC